MIKNTSSSYGSVTKIFHWLIFVLLAGMLTGGFFLDDMPKDYQPLIYNLHKLTGLTILCLMVLRALWASINIKPALPMGTPAWQRSAERILHFLLYITVIAMPLAGWIGACAGGRPPHIGDFKLALPIAENKPLAGFAFDIHGILAITIIVLASIHIAAALYHYFIKRDNVLNRML